MTLYSDFKLTFKLVSNILKYFSMYFSKNKGNHLRIVCQGNKLFFAVIIGGNFVTVYVHTLYTVA